MQPEKKLEGGQVAKLEIMEVTPVQSASGQKKKNSGRLWMALGYTMLLLSILGGSFIGPSSNLLTTKNGWVKTLWAHILRVFYCLPLVVAEVIMTKDYCKKVKDSLTKKNIASMLVAPIVFGYAQYALIYGADNIV